MKIKMKQGNEEINSTNGIILVGTLLELQAWENIDIMMPGRIKRGRIRHGEIFKIAVGLLALGKSDFADIELYRKDPLFKESLGLNKIPSFGNIPVEIE